MHNKYLTAAAKISLKSWLNVMKRQLVYKLVTEHYLYFVLQVLLNYVPFFNREPIKHELKYVFHKNSM